MSIAAKFSSKVMSRYEKSKLLMLTEPSISAHEWIMTNNAKFCMFSEVFILFPVRFY